MLKEKCEDTREQPHVMNETYELWLKNADENYRHFKNVTGKRMLRLYADVVLHLRKQSTSEANPVNPRSLSVDEMNDFKDMVKWMKGQNAMNRENLIVIIERNKRITELYQSNRKIVDDHLDAYLDRENTVTALRRELDAKTQADAKNRRRRRPKKKYGGDGPSGSRRPASSKPLNAVVHASRAELRAIRAAVRTLDDRVRTAEDVLLKVYDEALDHVEEMKVNNKNCEQKTIVRVQKFYDELKHFVPRALAVSPCQKNRGIKKDQYILNNYHPKK